MKKLHFFGQKSGQDLKNRAAHPHQEFPGVPRGGRWEEGKGRSLSSLCPLPVQPRALSFSFSPASPQHKEASAEGSALVNIPSKGPLIFGRSRSAPINQNQINQSILFKHGKRSAIWFSDMPCDNNKL